MTKLHSYVAYVKTKLYFGDDDAFYEVRIQNLD